MSGEFKRFGPVPSHLKRNLNRPVRLDQGSTNSDRWIEPQFAVKTRPSAHCDGLSAPFKAQAKDHWERFHRKPLGMVRVAIVKAKWSKANGRLFNRCLADPRLDRSTRDQCHSFGIG